MPKEMSEKDKKILSITVFVLFLAFCGAVSWFVGKPMISFVSEPEKFRVWVDSHGILGKLAFVGMMTFQVVIALVPGEPLEIGAGYAFGVVEGTILCVLGTLLGGLIVLFLVKKFGIKLCEVFFNRDKLLSLKILQNKKKRDLLFFLLFFLPGTPKDLLTYFVGLTDIKLSAFILLSSLARLPSVITSTMGGDALGVKEYKAAALVFILTMAVSLAGIFIYKQILKKREKKQK